LPFAIVDTGWAGRTQRALEFLIGTEGQRIPITGFYIGVIEQTGLACAGPMVGFTNIFRRLPLRRATSHLILMELLAQADHGPLAHFERGSGGKINPVLDDLGPANRSEIRAFHDSILRFVEDYIRVLPSAGEPEADWIRGAIQTYISFHDAPTEGEAEVFGRMPHSDQAKESTFQQLAPPLDFRQRVRAICRSDARPACWWIHAQAVLSRSPLLRAYLAAKRLKWLAQTTVTGKRE
jgi:hypothetical protein